MKEFLESFSNREIAILFWAILIFAYMFFVKISASINLIKSFFAKKLTYIYCLMLLYLGSIIYILSSLKLWEISLYKDFIFWLISSGFVILFSINKLKNNSDFKEILLKLLTINIVLEFIASNYNFSLIQELILIPFATVISLLIVVAQYKENIKVVKFLNKVLSYIGLSILGYVIYKLFKSPEELFTIKNLKSFLLAPLFTILFVPFVFLITTYSKYELIFINLNRYTFLKKERKSKIKLAILRFGNINLKYLNNAYNITIWRKSELLNKENIKEYICKEIKNDITFKE